MGAVMADIRQHVDRPDPTLLAVDEQMEARQQSRFRPYLGMSAIGGPCDRRLWLEFRWADKPRFEARTLYMFDDGHRTEDLMAARLRMVPGITLHTVDPSTGRQFGVDRKSTRLNSSHVAISYAVFCLKK